VAIRWCRNKSEPDKKKGWFIAEYDEKNDIATLYLVENRHAMTAGAFKNLYDIGRLLKEGEDEYSSYHGEDEKKYLEGVTYGNVSKV